MAATAILCQRPCQLDVGTVGMDDLRMWFHPEALQEGRHTASMA